MKPSGTTSYIFRGIINKLEKEYRQTKKPLYERILIELKKPSRRKRSLNLSKINRFTEEGENVIVLGKILSAGELKHKLNIIAFKASKTAIAKIKSSKSTVKFLSDWAVKPVIPEGVRILG